MPGSSQWAWSKSTRIKVMLVIDTAFFLLELIAGFLAHSLALTADAFHMVRCPSNLNEQTKTSTKRKKILVSSHLAC